MGFPFCTNSAMPISGFPAALLGSDIQPQQHDEPRSYSKLLQGANLAFFCKLIIHISIYKGSPGKMESNTLPGFPKGFIKKLRTL